MPEWQGAQIPVAVYMYSVPAWIQARLLHSAASAAAAVSSENIKTPALVIRTDVANVYGSKAPPFPFCDLQHPDIGTH